MGRLKNKKKSSELPDYDWPFEISIKISRYRPKVAFLSGVSRDYYPEDPGFSKFGLTYCLPIPDDTAVPNYLPPVDLLNKPISLLGYGIGGLSGPRFAPLLNEDTPPPNIYQSELIPPPAKKLEKAKRKKWNEFVEEYEEVVVKQYLKYEADEEGLGKQIESGKWGRKSIEVRPTRSAANTGKGHHHHHHRHKPKVRLDKKKELAKLCRKKFDAFGMGLQNTRFKADEKDDKIGVGTYDVNVSTMKPSFQITTPEGQLVPRVRVVCHPSGCDCCMVCKQQLYLSDYYQTIHKFRVVNKVDPEVEGPYNMRHLSLCRTCYCHALKNGCPPWTKDKIPRTFVKARHCSAIHDHKEGHPQFLMKTTCKRALNLARRELIYSRYFKDNPCEKAR